jgi:hypothetical protein
MLAGDRGISDPGTATYFFDVEWRRGQGIESSLDEVWPVDDAVENCRRLRHRVDWTRDVLVLVVHRACLDRPRWMSVDFSSVADRSGERYADHADRREIPEYGFIFEGPIFSG